MQKKIMRSFFSPKATKADERAFEDLFADPLLAPGARGDSMQDFSAGGLAYRAQGEAGSSAAHAALPSPMLQSQEASGRGNYFSDNSPKSDGHEVTVVLSRFSNAGEQGLGLVIDANFCILAAAGRLRGGGERRDPRGRRAPGGRWHRASDRRQRSCAVPGGRIPIRASAAEDGHAQASARPNLAVALVVDAELVGAGLPSAPGAAAREGRQVRRHPPRPRFPGGRVE